MDLEGNYVNLACASVTPDFPPSLISVIKAHEENLAIFGFNTSHPTTCVYMCVCVT